MFVCLCAYIRSKVVLFKGRVTLEVRRSIDVILKRGQCLSGALFSSSALKSQQPTPLFLLLVASLSVCLRGYSYSNSLQVAENLQGRSAQVRSGNVREEGLRPIDVKRPNELNRL